MQENPSELIDINNIKIKKTNDETNIQKNTTLYMNKNKNNNNVNNRNNNGPIRIDYYGQEILKNNKKHRISFIDQIQSKKDIAQIIYINEHSSLEDDKKDTNKYIDILRKQSTNITEFVPKENNNNVDTYKIKRPKKSSFSKKRKKIDSKEQCSCIIF